MGQDFCSEARNFSARELWECPCSLFGARILLPLCHHSRNDLTCGSGCQARLRPGISRHKDRDTIPTFLSKEQLRELATHAEQTEQTLTAFQETLREQAEQIQTATSTSMESFQSQVGKASESFSQQLSSEEQTLKRSLKKLILASLIPTILLIIWELIRHIWLPTC